MALRDFSSLNYIPMLSTKVAEMQALQELPDLDKQIMMPLFQIGPWAASHQLQSTFSRLDEVYGDRPCFVTLAEFEPPATERPVHRQLAALRMPHQGYDAWCALIESRPNFVPALQIGDFSQMQVQASRLHALGRGLIVQIEREGFRGIPAVAEIVGPVTEGGRDVCFMIDFRRVDRDILNLERTVIEIAPIIFSRSPHAYIAVCGSSFPDSFVNLASQNIFERQFFEILRGRLGERLIYSDRGSARAERQSGGSGSPPPRIDYASPAQWTFFRSDEEGDRQAAYATQARLATRSEVWDRNLRIWGTQMIERTALGDSSAIGSQQRSAAARINIHLHRQLFYEDPSRLYDTDDTWTD